MQLPLSILTTTTRHQPHTVASNMPPGGARARRGGRGARKLSVAQVAAAAKEAQKIKEAKGTRAWLFEC